MSKLEGGETPPLGTLQLPWQANYALRAFKYRNFRWYMFGLMVSLAGTYMQQLAEGWLLYEITNSAFSLGWIGFITMLPMVPWTLVAGALADRMSKKNLLMIVQIGQIFPPLILAWLTWTGHVQIWHVIVLNVVMGAMSTIDQPTRQALIAEMVEGEDLDNALALTSVGMNIARVLGPALAGVLIGLFGLSGVFVLNSTTFAVVIFALLMVTIAPYQQTTMQKSLGGALLDGIRYLLSERLLLVLIFFMMTASLFLLPYQTLLPVFARDVFRQGATGLGLMTAAAGVGAIFGALSVTYISSARYGRFTILLALITPLFMLVFAITQHFGLACLMLALCSAGIVALKTVGFTVVQIRTPNELRGRITSLLLLMMGATPRIGGLLLGYTAALVGAPFAMSLGASGSLIGGLIVVAFFLPQLRRLR